MIYIGGLVLLLMSDLGSNQGADDSDNLSRGARHQLFVIRADGNTAVRFAYLRVKPPFNTESVMFELLRK
jgi:hypothetical protein